MFLFSRRFQVLPFILLDHKAEGGGGLACGLAHDHDDVAIDGGLVHNSLETYKN